MSLVTLDIPSTIENPPMLGIELSERLFRFVISSSMHLLFVVFTLHYLVGSVASPLGTESYLQ